MQNDVLKLENQLCFPLYAASKEIIRKYKPFLDKYDITYTQYLVMLVLWEEDNINVKALGEKLFLDSGTLTPLLKKLESKKYIHKVKLEKDTRNVIISLTKEGKELKSKCINIPGEMGNCINLSKEEANTRYILLYKALKEKSI